jgi:hypothetical protein
MKKIIALTLITAIVFTGCSSNSGAASVKSKEAATIAESEITTAQTKTVTKIEEQNTTNAKESTEEVAADKETESASDADVETENVKITMPAKYMEGTTQEELDQDYNTYATATLNEDGSVTFVMSKVMHAAFIEIIEKELTDQLNSMVGSSDFPTITSIEMNDNFTEFNLTTTSTVLSEDEATSSIYFYMFGDMYNIFNQTESNIITVNFINADTSEIIHSSDSSEMDTME